MRLSLLEFTQSCVHLLFWLIFGLILAVVEEGDGGATLGFSTVGWG